MTGLEGPERGPAAGGGARQLVVLLHGLGANGRDLIELADPWSQVLPHAAFVAPDGPESCEGVPFGRQWFALWDRTPEQLEAGARAAAGMLDPFLDAALVRRGLAPDAYVLMGFSQGAMMALHVGLRRPVGPRAILAYSGALLAHEVLAAELANTAPVLLVHGEDDPVVPVGYSRMTEEALRAAGVPVEAHFVPGLAHGIDPTGLAAGAGMLRRAFR